MLEKSVSINRSIPRSWVTSSAISAILTGLTGYGIWKFTFNDFNVPATTTTILDAERLPLVKYASLEDMKKVSLEQPLVQSQSLLVFLVRGSDDRNLSKYHSNKKLHA